VIRARPGRGTSAPGPDPRRARGPTPLADFPGVAHNDQVRMARDAGVVAFPHGRETALRALKPAADFGLSAFATGGAQ